MLQAIVCIFITAIGLVVVCGFLICLTWATFMQIFSNAIDKYYKVSKNGGSDDQVSND